MPPTTYYDALKAVWGASYSVMMYKSQTLTRNTSSVELFTPAQRFVKLGRFLLRVTFFVVVLSVSAWSFPARAVGQQPAGVGSEGQPAASDSSATPRFSLADLSWLEGEWNGAWGARMAHQVWSAAHDGTMMGTLQIVEAGKTLVIEVVSISNTPAGVEYRLLHFTSALAPWETSGPAVLTLMSIDSKRFVFENQSSGEPRRIIFMRDDTDSYTARSEIEPASGDSLNNEITFHRKVAPLPRKKFLAPLHSDH